MTSSANPLENAISVDAVADKAQQLVDDHRCRDLLSETIAIHRYCLNEIEYKQYENIRSAEAVLESGDGDCTDQSVLLASMLLARDIPVRLIHVQDHIFPEALLQSDPEDINKSRIRKLYNLSPNAKIWVLGDVNRHDNVDTPGYWYTVDPEMSRYLGDLQIHAKEKLLVKENGEWSWSSTQMCKATSPEDFQPA